MASNQYNTKSIYTEALNDLFNVNVNSESLKQFLENIVNVVNNQSKQMQSLQQQLDQKPDSVEIEKGFKSISDSINIYDNELQKTINNLIEKPKQENTGNKVEDGANKVCNKIVMLGHACTLLYRANKGWDKKLDDLAVEIPKKLERDEMKAKVKKTKSKLVNELDELKRKLTKQMDDLSKKTVSQINKFEIEVKDVEKKTLWKIQDCEQLLGKRITGEFVDNSIKCLEDKIRREMLKMKDDNFGGINNAIEDLEDKFKQFEENNADRLKNVKQAVKDLEDTFLNKFTLSEKHESNKKIVQDKISEIETKLISLDRKGDANAVLEQSRDLVRQLEAKLYDQSRQLNEFSDKVEHLSSKSFTGDKRLKTGSSESDDCIDPHKLCLVEANLKRLRDEFNEQKRNYTTLEQDIRRKFDTFEHKVLGNFALLKKQNQSEFNRDEMIGLIERGKVMVEEKVKQMAREFEEMKPKINGITELEKKIKKKFRDLNEGTEISKKIAEKADILDVNRQNSFMDEKIRQLTDTISAFKREFEQIEDFYMQLNSMIKNNQQEAISVITGNTKVIPNRCVACGTKGRQTQHMSDMKGADGKIYKADFGGASAFDHQEVFDVYPSQLSPERTTGFSYSSKQQVVSFKERPSSSKGNSSAKK